MTNDLRAALAEDLHAEATAYATDCHDEDGEPLEYDQGWIAALRWAAERVGPKPEPARGEGIPSMPYVNGKRFFCGCGVSVFTHYPAVDVFVCNGCQTEYAGS